MKTVMKPLAILSLLTLFSCQEQLLEPVINSDPVTTETQLIIDTSISLSAAEIESLLFMREEEKLARDVYLTYYQWYQSKQFGNIADSEQKHTDAVARLLAAFEIPDPVVSDEIGVFENSFLETLYLELTEKGQESQIEALKMGALIEEIDIQDLRLAADTLTHSSVLEVYDNLEKGSRNHLRAYYSSLKKQGIIYEPVVLDLELFNSIISSEMESGN